MTNKELKKLSRADLLRLLLEQTKENEALRAELIKTKKLLKSKEICIQNCGSMAEAALKLNGMFQAADRACKQYIENVKRSAGKYDEKE